MFYKEGNHGKSFHRNGVVYVRQVMNPRSIFSSPALLHRNCGRDLGALLGFFILSRSISWSGCSCILGWLVINPWTKEERRLWWLATISLLWAIWIERKRRIFEDSQTGLKCGIWLSFVLLGGPRKIRNSQVLLSQSFVEVGNLFVSLLVVFLFCFDACKSVWFFCGFPM